jgi:hypothetical protein
MGDVVWIDPARRRKPVAPELAIDKPKVRALKRLAETLEKTRLKPSDRAQMGANWHAILKVLKQGRDSTNERSSTKEWGLTKENIYKVLQREGTYDSAQKKSLNYELPPTLSGEAKIRRIGKLTQHGGKWLKLVERSEDLAGMGRHELLPELLKGTSLAAPTVAPYPDTPDPIASLLQLANAACQRIARQVDLKRYFTDWNRGWVRHRFKDGVFLPEPVDEADDNDWLSRMIQSDYELLEDEPCDRPFINGMPLPYVSFGKWSRFRSRRA